jgi:flagellar assembly factor FliW
VCVDGTRLRFAVINPLLFRSDYSPNINKEEIEELSIKQPEDILLYTIVTIAENPLQSTANLIGPVIINKTKRTGRQVIIEDERYSTREPILRKN